jgi:outer membrane immunogenic protein
MKKLLLATTAIVMLSAGAPAIAADMAVKAMRPLAPPCAAAKFAGGYVGINGGGVVWTANRTDQDEVLVDTASYVQKKSGGVIGGQIGYNWASCNTMFGVELDGDWSNTKVTTQLIPNAQLFNINIASRFDSLYTGRVRTGIVMDNLLLYITGGVAAAHFRTVYTNQFLGLPAFGIPGFIAQADNNQTRWGLVAGFGAEWAWTPNWSVRTEILYADFPERERRFLFAPPTTFANFTESDSMWITRIGVNYRFGGGPVYAAY